jgi:acyl dehydratase
MDRLPATYPHMLAFPLQMRIMTERAFPFGVLGLVHIENSITQHRPVSPNERLTVSVQAQDLRDHERGKQFTMAATAHVGDELVWVSRSVYLRRTSSGGGSSSKERDEAAPVRGHWRVPADIGRRYGAVSGDRNPIHLHDVSARLFGMPRAIAHGMWLKARALAALEPELPATFTAGVRFKKPVLLPATVAFSTTPHDDGRAFAVHDAQRGIPHLDGRVSAGPVAG